jgi:uncharacterized membrane protein YjjP (DUF1212 family)
VQPAASRGIKKSIRALLQTIAGGGCTALVALLAGGLSPQWASTLTIIFGAFAALLQNYFETKGTIPVLLPTPGLVTTTVGGVVGKTVGTVDTVTTEAETVVGDVLNNAGEVLGAVTGIVPGLGGK